jgi:hypothetical protein
MGETTKNSISKRKDSAQSSADPEISHQKHHKLITLSAVTIRNSLLRRVRIIAWFQEIRTVETTIEYSVSTTIQSRNNNIRTKWNKKIKTMENKLYWNYHPLTSIGKVINKISLFPFLKYSKNWIKKNYYRKRDMKCVQ